MNHRYSYILAILVLVFLLCGVAGAQLAELIAEVQDDRFQYSVGSSSPRGFVQRGSRALFVGDDGEGGSTLWGSDGTTAGTQAVLDDVLSIVAFDEDDLWVHRRGELWWSNGRAGSDGVHRRLGPVSFDFEAQQIDESRLLVIEQAPDSSRVLVVDDSTYEVLRENSSRNAAFSEDKVFFQDPLGSVWGSDGSVGGTRLIYAVHPAAPIVTLVTTDDFAYWLTLNSSLQKRELWRSDGSLSSPELVSLYPSTGAGQPQFLVATAESVFWIAGEPILNLWRIRDDEALARQRTFSDWSNSFRFFGQPVSREGFELEETPSGVYFVNSDSNQDTYLWFLRHGSQTPEKLVFICRDCRSGVDFVIASDDALSFSLHPPLTRPALWFSGSTPESTRRLFACYFGACGTEIESFGLVAATHIPGSNDIQLVRVDPQAGTAEELVSIGLDDLQFNGGRIEGAFIEPSTLLFQGKDEVYGVEPQVLILGDSSPSLLRDLVIRDASGPQLIPGQADDVAFEVDTGSLTVDLGLTEGTAQGTSSTTAINFPCDTVRNGARLASSILVWCGGSLYSINPATGTSNVLLERTGSGPRSTILSADMAVFVVSSTFDDPQALWSTDGTQQGTKKLTELSSPLRMRILESASGTAYVAVIDALQQWKEVFSTDGTVLGTTTLAEFSGPGSVEIPDGIVRTLLTDHWLYAVVFGTGRMYRVGRTAGVVEDLSSQLATVGSIRNIVGAGPAVELFLERPEDVARYRITDTTSIPVFQNLASSGSFFSFPSRNVRLNSKTVAFTSSRILVMGDDGGYAEHDIQLTSRIAHNGEEVYFAARTQERGEELWKIDSSQAPPRLVHDVWPGPASSFPRQPMFAGDRLFFTANDGLHGREIWTLLPGSTPCQATDFSLCLREGQFKVDMRWRDFSGNSGRGNARPVTTDTGAFWFFDEDNLETMVKVLDARGINNHYWTFLGSLSNVGFSLTVTDSETGYARRYRNSPGGFASLGDVLSLDVVEQSTDLLEPGAGDLEQVLNASTDISLDNQPCRAGPAYLCLQEDRFEVSVTWEDFSGNQGEGVARPLQSDSGSFWFFDERNLELLVKVLDGTGINGHFWVFYGSLTNVAFELRVRDTQSGIARRYTNSVGQFASAGDVEAFGEE